MTRPSRPLEKVLFSMSLYAVGAGGERNMKRARKTGGIISVKRSFIKAPGDENPRLVSLHEMQEEGTKARGILKEVSVG